ncbi:hypothetical protein G9464_11330 [Halostella sp. JP-L12]|uniref:hypothetical protein n=1 Tax=Halostella TaxID=1843185 RepID=UPI000EF80618|nr:MULTISPECIES: hypothetical protein [Halostella]NHN48189.1 hypothetical protein [Halostella sp. JP-L12]
MSEFEGLADSLSCAECGETIEGGYVPADGGTLRRDEAVCETCGWGTVGHMGCAPTRGDFDAPDALVRVEDGPGDYAVGDVKE